MGALAVERTKRHEEVAALFAFTAFIRSSDVQLLIYEFNKLGLRFSLVSAVHRAGSRRLFARGEPVFLGFWPYADSDDPVPPFDQDVCDRFEDIGDLNHGDEEGGGQR